MNSETYSTIPDDLKSMVKIDESIPAGLVEMRPSGLRLPVDEWVAKRRRAHKQERQNKRKGRLAAKR